MLMSPLKMDTTATIGMMIIMMMPSTIPPTVFSTFLSVSRATAIFLSAAATVALIKKPPFRTNKNRRHKAYGSLYFSVRIACGGSPPHRPPAFPKSADLYSGAMTCKRYRSLPQR